MKSAIAVTIANGTTDSALIPIDKETTVTFLVPATVSETINLYAGTDSLQLPYKDGGSAVTMTASDCFTLVSVGAPYLKLVAGSAVGAARTIYVIVSP